MTDSDPFEAAPNIVPFRLLPDLRNHASADLDGYFASNWNSPTIVEDPQRIMLISEFSNFMKVDRKTLKRNYGEIYFQINVESRRETYRRVGFDRHIYESVNFRTQKTIGLIFAKPSLTRYTIGLFSAFVTLVFLAAVLAIAAEISGRGDFSIVSLYLMGFSALFGIMCSDRVKLELGRNAP